jgi:pimeloyl-ACP methyl ester carboxylesterase
MTVQRGTSNGTTRKRLAAVVIGRVESAYAFDLTRVKAPAMIYCGSEDGPANCEPDAELLHPRVGIIEGADHFGGFADVNQVMDLAIPFLESISSPKAC